MISVGIFPGLYRRQFCRLCAYSLKPGMVIFHDGRYLEILKAAPSTNKKLPSTYKLELLDLFANRVAREYFRYAQIENFDLVETSTIAVEFQYPDEERNLLIFSDNLYNQHEVPAYLFRGNTESIQPGLRFVLMMDGDRYIRII
jgi:translation elongation factor P/translation initiation factor 5A